MARKESTVLTEAELRLMDVLWARGASTVTEVLEGLPQETPLAYNTVLTTLRILEDKGYLTHEKEGRAFVYKAKVPREKARQSALRLLLSRFFDNSAEQLVHN
ncbi:MAG: BlaI/MecI/CopY family transcriptional regulator, partial [Acidobacteria bacterium]|nr:BlaI/MecI/CopY family transcriptional regulator [Acidobacteriota bacterium]